MVQIKFQCLGALKNFKMISFDQFCQWESVWIVFLNKCVNRSITYIQKNAQNINVQFNKLSKNELNSITNHPSWSSYEHLPILLLSSFNTRGHHHQLTCKLIQALRGPSPPPLPSLFLLIFFYFLLSSWLIRYVHSFPFWCFISWIVFLPFE